MARTLSDIRRVNDEYAYNGIFRSKQYETHDQLAIAEAATPCVPGADHVALFVLRPPGRPAGRSPGVRGGRWNLTIGHHGLRTELRVPWCDMTYRLGRIFWTRILWFHVVPMRLDI